MEQITVAENCCYKHSLKKANLIAANTVQTHNYFLKRISKYCKCVDTIGAARCKSLVLTDYSCITS